MKKKVFLSSIATIALCLCLIAGSTFALFTSQSEIDIAVTAAKVEMTANITDPQLWSVRPATPPEITNNPETIIEDEFGGQYVYAERKDTFANGGTAIFKDGILTLDRITPGDKVAFNIEGANESDVTIQYRYIIECVSGEKLMSGLLFTIEGVECPYLGRYTSGWATLTPGNDIDPTPSVVIEFPVTAGNEYQEESVEIKVTVEAVQGNAAVSGSNYAMIEFLDGYAIDFEDTTVSNIGVVNYNDVDISNGTILLNDVGVENYGDATLTNMTIKAGTSGTQAYGYAFISNAGSVSVLNNVTVNSANGAIAATDGAELTFNGGYVEVDSKSTSGRYLFYVVGEGTVATINDGEFFFNKTQNQKRAYAYVGEGATLYINGGTFGKASTRSGYTAGILGEGTVIITGGIFGFDPTKWVADGYKAVKNGAQWYVVPENVDAVVNDVAELADALNAGNDNITVYNVTFTENALANGHNHRNVDVTFVNCTFTGKNDWNYIRNATYIGCTFDVGSENAAMHFDQLYGTLTVTDCTFVSGKIQIGTTDNASAIFTNCTFGETASTSIWAEKGMRFYAPTTFENCEFNNRVVLAGSNGLALTFNGCTMNGGAPVYYVDNTDGIIRGGNIPTVTINQ